MNRVLKILAIAVLAVTIAGAGAVLYAVRMFTPQVEQVTVLATPAVQAQDVFDEAMDQLALGTFMGREFDAQPSLRAQDCTFLTYTVRLANRGFFPAEWIALVVTPRSGADGAAGDVLQLADSGTYVLGAGSRGDLSATILTTLDAADTQRELEISCYVFGKKTAFTIAAQ